MIKDYINIKKGVKHKFNHTNLTPKDVIYIEMRINSLNGNGAYQFGFPSYDESFGFYSVSGGISTASKNGVFNVTVKRGETIIRGDDIPLKEWFIIEAIPNRNIYFDDFVIPLHLYKGDDYDIRDFKINRKSFLREEKAKKLIKWTPIYTNDQSKWLDAQPFLEQEFNSGRGAELKGGIYPTSKTTNANIPTTINMSGRGIVNEYLDNNSLTKIIPLGNFNAININSKDVYINNGNIYTGLLDKNNKAAIQYNSDAQIWGGALTGMTLQGSINHLTETGGGTRGIKINTHDLVNPDPHTSYVDFNEMRFEYLYSGIGKLAQNEKSLELRKDGKIGLWINSLNIINPKFKGCKMTLDFQFASNYYMSNANIQDDSVLNEEEKELPLIRFRGKNSFIEYQPYDMDDRTKTINGVILYRHNVELEKLENDTTTVFLNRFNRR